MGDVAAQFNTLLELAKMPLFNSNLWYPLFYFTSKFWSMGKQNLQQNNFLLQWTYTVRMIPFVKSVQQNSLL